MNYLLIQKFTEAVFDFYVVQKICLSDVFKIMKGSRERKIRLTAEYLCSELEKGCLLSEALFGCEIIHFDPVYVMFVKFSEKTGDLAGVFSFLKERCERKKKSIQKMVDASVYPVFVIVAAIVLCLIFVFYGKSLSLDLFCQDSESKVSFVKELLLLIVVSGGIFLFFLKNMKENKLYEAFLGMGFLIKSGVNVSLAVGYGMLLVGPDSRYGKLFLTAQQRLEYGMDLMSAFGFSNGGGGRFLGRRNKVISEALYFAQQSGNRNDVFEKVANQINSADEKKRKLCLSLVEPVLIMETGVFLMILLGNFLLPFLTNINLV